MQSLSLAQWAREFNKQKRAAPQGQSLLVVDVGSGVSSSGELSGEMAGVLGRLRDLGFHTGEHFEFLGFGPFGSPFFVVIRDTVLALRENEAEAILVKPLWSEGSGE